MTTQPLKEKTLSFRISRALWIRIGDMARRLGVTSQSFCTEAIERHLDRAEKKDPDDVNGHAARKVIDQIRKAPRGGK